MSTFKFESSYHGFGSPTNTLEFEADDIEDVVFYFSQFLKGSGFVFDGDVVLQEETESEESNFDFNNLPQNNWPFGSTPLNLEHPLVCPVCRIDNETMSKHACYDTKCPKGNNDANQR